MEIRTFQKQAQVLSPQMVLSMEILQMGTQELLEHVETAIQENPVLDDIKYYDGGIEYQSIPNKLEWMERADFQNRYYNQQDRESQAANLHYEGVATESKNNLYDHVRSQLETMMLEPQLAACAVFLAGCLNRNGWIEEDLSCLAREFNQPIVLMEQALSVVQSLEPAGIGARNLSECLCLQLKRRMPVDQLALSIVADYLVPLAKTQYGLIARALDVTQKDVCRASEVVRNLNPCPGAAFIPIEHIDYITPDIIVTTFPDHFELIQNECLFPSLSISSYYSRLLKESNEEAVKSYLAGKIQQAKWIIWAIEQRRNTMLACAKCILELQEDFFRKGPGHLIPMSLSNVARRIGMHESTVSRAVRDKYLQCSMGVYPLSYFFVRRLGSAAKDASPSSDTAKALLKKLIAQENKNKPLSDQKLCEQMAAQGCLLSRRTVAKYRDELNIPGMSGRKR